MLSLLIIIGLIYLLVSTNKVKKLALSSGVDADDLSTFNMCLWLYILPPLLWIFFPSLFDSIISVLVALFYVPGIVTAKKLADKLRRGGDQSEERKASKEYKKAVWLGYAGVCLVVLNWIFVAGLDWLKS